jgi:protein-disulfide isomerase
MEMSPTSAEQVRRANRIRLLLMAVGVAAILVAGLVAISRLGGDEPTADGPEASDLDRTAALVDRSFVGIPQSGAVLGDPKAPVTLIEFADLQCPYCALVATEGALPEVIDRYVRTGKINIELKLTKALGPDSVKAASVAAAAADQDRMWQFAELFFFNQGAENSGYVTPAFLRSIATRVKGLDAARAVEEAVSPRVRGRIDEWARQATTANVPGTPAFYLQEGDAPATRIETKLDDVGTFSRPIEAALRR